MNHKKEFLSHIKNLQKFGTGVCIHRLNKLFTLLDLHEYVSNSRKVVITGTNGKGSVSCITANILKELNYKVGLFTSPHFYEFNERFRVDGENLSYEFLNSVAQTVYDAIKKVETETQEKFGVFEIQFCIAILSFKELQADFLVIEAGIGGRYDPCRILKSELTALTSIDLEHTGILGDSLDMICFDKIDACFPNGSIVCGISDQNLKNKLLSYCDISNRSMHFSYEKITANLGKNSTVNVSFSDKSSINCKTHLAGFFQERNIEIAISLVMLALPKHDTKSIKMAIHKALETTIISGRFEKILSSPEAYVDSAHTPNAFKLLFETIKYKFKNKKIIFVTGVSEGRNTECLVDGLRSTSYKVILSKPSFRGAEVESLKKRFSIIEDKLIIEPNMELAINRAKELCKDDSYIIFIAGGLFLAGEASAKLLERSSENIFLY